MYAQVGTPEVVFYSSLHRRKKHTNDHVNMTVRKQLYTLIFLVFILVYFLDAEWKVLPGDLENTKGDFEFKFECNDRCDCLPQYDPNILYFHQSYRTRNSSYWPTGWKFLHGSCTRHFLNSHLPWNYIFWKDAENELLARCLGHSQIYNHFNRSIDKADMSRVLYLIHYGGLYMDMDTLCLKPQDDLLFREYSKYDLMFGKGSYNSMALEWGFARKRNNSFLQYCLRNHMKKMFGAKGTTTCAKKFYGGNKTQKLFVVPSRLVNPYTNWTDHRSNCGKIRTWSSGQWKDHWESSECSQELQEKGTYTHSVFSASWWGKK